MPNITCDLCGGTDFYCDAGFYYCSECQRQTQDIQDHVFEEPAEAANVRKSRTVTKKSDNEKHADRITTWECYNYIVLGLVKELIELGASENLKSTVEVLWFKYLKELGVIGIGDAPPKLSAYNSNINAEIVYGRKVSKKRKARSRSGSPSSATDISTLDHISIRRERTRQKRALAKAKYAEFLSGTQQSDVSLVNQSLHDLKASSDTGKKDPTKFLKFHPSASKELKKKMTKNHLRDHCRDVNSVLTCHKLSAKMVSKSYIDSPLVISRNKIYSIIYLGLLINKESIQLGDMLRYIREGYMNFDYCNHFFPEEVLEKNLNVCTFNHGNSPLVSVGLRICSLKMATFLNVKKYMPVQNLVELCKRYCEELNLPDSIYKFALKLISRSKPYMSIYKQQKCMPNYEARAMGFIIFALKFLFSLDDATEFEISKLAEAIDKNLHENEHKTFSFSHWLKHIEYRKLILSDFHFPTQYINESFSNPKNFVGFMNWYNERVIDDEKLALDMQLIKNQLELIKENDTKFVPEKFSYRNSLTPFRDYVKRLVNLELAGDQNHFTKLLSANFSKTSIDFVNHMDLYKKLFQPDTELTYKHGGKNDDIKIICLFNRECERFKHIRVEKADVKVTFARNDSKRKILKHDRGLVQKFKENPTRILQDFEDCNSDIYENNRLETKEAQKKVKQKIPDVSTKTFEATDFDNCVYNPSERFCLNMQNTAVFNLEEVKEYVKSLPRSFQLVLKECGRIIEQGEKELYVEYNLVEAYLCYVLDIKQGRQSTEKFVDRELNKVLDSAKKMW